MSRPVIFTLLAVVVLGAVIWFFGQSGGEDRANVGDGSHATGLSESNGPAPLDKDSAARGTADAAARELAKSEPKEASAPGGAKVTTGIAGTVLSPGGQPLAGATVEVFFPMQIMMMQEQLGSTLGVGTTAADGTFLVPLPRSTDRALVMAHGHGGGRVERDRVVVTKGSITKLEPLTLKPASSLAGFVHAPDGAPIAGASILIGHRPTERILSISEPDECVVTTGADGRYLAEDLQPGTKDLKVRAKGFANDGRAGIELLPEQKQDGVDFALTPEMTISGVIRSTNGEPIAGAEVEAYLHDPEDDIPEPEDDEEEETEYDEPGSSLEVAIMSWGTCTSAADGSFTITGLTAGAFDLSARHPDFEPFSSEATTAAGATGVKIAMTPFGWVYGRVIDGKSGAPIPRFTAAVGNVSSPDAGGAVRDGFPFGSPDGTFAIQRVSQGSCVVHVIADGYAPADVGPVPVPNTRERPIEVPLFRGAVVRGVVKSERTGVPIAGVRMRLDRRAAKVRVAIMDRALDPELRTVTDSEGRFRFENVADGGYSIGPADWKLVGRDARSIEITGQDTIDLEPILVSTSGSITGNARDSLRKTRGLANVFVVAECGKLKKQALTDANGRYRIAPLPFGEYTVRIIRFDQPEDGSEPPPAPQKTVTVFEGQEAIVDLE